MTPSELYDLLPAKLDTSLYSCDDTGIEARHCAEHGNAIIDLCHAAILKAIEQGRFCWHEKIDRDKLKRLVFAWKDDPYALIDKILNTFKPAVQKTPSEEEITKAIWDLCSPNYMPGHTNTGHSLNPKDIAKAILALLQEKNR